MMKDIKLKILIKRHLRAITELLGLTSKIAIEESDLSKSKLLIISFTGGMGAQIISAAILFHFKSKGYSVKADLDYFKKDCHVATVGNKGEISHWDWQLDDYDLTMETIESHSAQVYHRNADTYYLPDGQLKARLAMIALRDIEVKKQFKMPRFDKIVSACPELQFLYINQQPYICIHIRRGDYVNVASHIVSDDEFVQLAEKFKHLVDSIVIVSDSLLEERFKDRLRLRFKQTVFLDGSAVNVFVTHCIMRNSNILVCSNSQYSLTAGALNDGLVIIPKAWLGVGHEELKAEIEKFYDFAVLS
jgi:hypothetical protein